MIYALASKSDGTIFVGYDTTGTATAAAVTTVTNGGKALAYPTIVIKGPSSGSSRIYQLLNATTGRLIYLDLTISAAKQYVLTSSRGTTLTSSSRGDVSGAILPGSSSDFALVKGTNSIYALWLAVVSPR